MQTKRASGRIIVVSATIGAGHDAVTGELAQRLRRRGFDVRCHDFTDLLPLGLGKQFVRGHQDALRHAPWLYGLLFGIGDRFRTTPPLTRLLLYPVRRRLLELVDDEVEAVVSTYPLASQVIGPLRRTGRLRAPALTYATDFAVHRHWVAPGVDAHLTAHQVGAAQARAYRGRRPRVAGALVADRFRPAPAAGKEAARSAFGLPAGRLALVVSGAWGVGNIEATAIDIAESGQAIPVVVCGRNDALRNRLLQLGIPYALGWVDDIVSLMHAVDVLVENAGATMALEGLACGLPVVTYRALPGHGKLSAAAMARAGLATWVRRRDDLGPALVDAVDGVLGDRQRHAAQVLFTSDAADCIAELIQDPRIRRHPVLGRIRTAAAVAAGAACALAAVALLTRSRRPATR
jgi:UDP-N-acetylglucosamine:LPS N-acetylglucosamine transferase